SLAANASCTINVTFTPQATGSRTASVTLTDNAASSPQTIALTGTGTTTAPSVTLNPTSLAFGNQITSATTPAQTVTLTNSGGTAINITTIDNNDQNPSYFPKPNTSPPSLAANASCTINVTFTPAAIGARSATLAITDNAANSPQSLALTGTGVNGSVYF